MQSRKLIMNEHALERNLFLCTAACGVVLRLAKVKESESFGLARFCDKEGCAVRYLEGYLSRGEMGGAQGP
jgi:hypothetical protein